MARTPKPVDLDRLRTLAMVGLSNVKIAELLNVSHDTLTRRFRKQLAESRNNAESRILGKIYQLALGGNVRCLELAAINRCGWANKPELVVNVQQNAGGFAVDDQVRQKLAKLHREIREQAQLPDGRFET